MLHDLETLDLRDTFIEELPGGIVQLIKLQHLLMKNMYGTDETRIPIGIGNMTNLLGISGFNITSSSVHAVEELGKLINLIVLHVRYIADSEESHKYRRHGDMLLSSLCKLGSFKLQSVCIDGGNSCPFELLDSWSSLPSYLQSYKMSTPYSLSKLPKWIAPLASLAYLDINLSVLTEQGLRILGVLPALLSLELHVDNVQKEMLPVKGVGFRCLKEFVYALYEGTTGNLLFEEGALPKLEKLELPFFVSTARAYCLYLGIEHLPCLKDLDIVIYNKGATSSECEAAAVAIRKEASQHPNHPRLTLSQIYKGSDTDDDEVSRGQSDAIEES